VGTRSVLGRDFANDLILTQLSKGLHGRLNILTFRVETLKLDEIVIKSHVGGLVKSFHRKAA
jgi:hypothetical protein